MNRDHVIAHSNPPLTHLVDRFRYWAQHQPSAVAFYFVDERDRESQVTYAQLDRQARAIAAHLTSLDLQGERALLLYPPGLEFVAAFFGCLYAGTVAVPAYPPRRNRNMARVESIYDDAQAAIALSVQEVIQRSQGIVAEAGQLQKCRWLATDRIPDEEEMAAAWRMPAIQSDHLAVLQYTSGSTGSPKGVMLTHSNLIHNCVSITSGFQTSRDEVGLTWLPTYHDMGLVGGVLKPAFLGRPNVFMSPMAFLQKPIRWLRGITRYRVTISGGPNFAYALCNEKITEQQCEGLDLSTWGVAFNGAEPVRAETLETFARKFAPYGFRAEAHYPCYGMAETTLIVTGGFKGERPVVKSFDARLLEAHRAVPTKDQEEEGKRLVGCGHTLFDTQIAIVDPDTGHRLPEDHVGEIWISSPSVAQGYWNNPQETEKIFRAHVSHHGGTNYLRTGDLGFFHGGELFVTGRLKDVIIVRGRNLYPHDIEATVEGAHDVLRRGGGVAFAIEEGGEERLVVAHEIEREHRKANLQEVIEAIRQAIVEQHEVPAFSILLLKTGSLAKTSSGKVQRRSSRDAFLKGELQAIAAWTADEDQAQHGARGAAPAAGARPPSAKSAQAIRGWLVARIAQQLGVSPDRVDVHEAFARFGLDSVALVGISGELEDWLESEVSPTLLYGYPTIAALADHLAVAEGAATTTAEGQRSQGPAEPIAIVGMSCRFPGANHPDEFWELLCQGVDALGDVPADRWDVDRYFDPNPETQGKMYTRRGGFLPHVDRFDPQFFELSPREAETLDPQQRLLLEVSWEALEHAGQSPQRLAGTDAGIFVGITNCDYGRLQDRALGVEGIDAHSSTGTLNSVAAGRVAYFLGLHGPTLAVDTACSSSLVAVHLAAESLRKGECRAALAGGVNLILDPAASVALSAARALSPSGACHTFDEAADGYVRGEGCGMVVLKRLDDALADGDRILALLRGSAVNHDGRSNGLTAPHGPSQVALIQQALQHSGIRPDQVGYLEAHGTGTTLGDPIEVEALAEVFDAERAEGEGPPLAIGSVKTNIGHLEAAAGIASLLKVVLALQHGEIPPHLHLHQPNPFIPWQQLRLVVPTRQTPLPKVQGRRIAGVSSFGFSGTNAHVVVEEAPEPARGEVRPDRPQHLLVLSAKNEEALQDLAHSYDQYLSGTAEPLGDICFTAAAGRAHFGHRLAVRASDREECRQQLARAPAHRVRTPPDCPRVALLFTGQGSQTLGMGRSLYETQPTFRAALDRCDQLLSDQLPQSQSLLSVLYDPAASEARLQQTAFAQPAIFALEFALFQLWKSWGLEPAAVMGHSVGEFAAACAAGVFSLEDGLKLIAARGRLMQSLPKGGCMFAVAADQRQVEAALSGGKDEVAIAAINGPQQTVISGAAEAVGWVVRQLEAAGVTAQPLEVSHAFHSTLMEPILEDFAGVCQEVTFHMPRCPIVTNVHGRLDNGQMARADYWQAQIRQPVRFADGIQALADMGVDTFLEIGPKPVLTFLGRLCLGDGDGQDARRWLSSLRPGVDDWTQILSTLADLYLHGAEVDWEGFDRDYPRRKLALPTYPFQRQRYWFTAAGAGEESRAAGRKDPRTGAAAGSQTATAAEMADAFYEIRWQPKSLFSQPTVRRAADYLADPAGVAASVGAEVERVERQLQLDRYRTLEDEMERLSVAYVRAAFADLGWNLRPGEQVTAAALFAGLGVVPAQQALCGRMCQLLVGKGLEDGPEGQWTVAGPLPPAQDPAGLEDDLRERYPECDAELDLLQQCGRKLADVLRGAADPLQVLFPEGSATLVERLYADSPFARSLNALVEECITRTVAGRPEGRPLRILEIGGGTGGTTARILPRLPAAHTEYLFTDVSEIFTQEARRKFREFPFVRYGTLDIELDPQSQGFAAEQFDVVLAANVLHATRDLRQAIGHVRQLLAPQGMLILLEGTRPQGWLDLIFGLTDGWWRFVDTDLRPRHPLISPPQWTRVLHGAGFESALAMPGQIQRDGHAVDAPQSVILARREAASQLSPAEEVVGLPSASEDCWLILADRQGVGEALAGLLDTRGVPHVLVSHGTQYQQLDDQRFVIQPADGEDLQRVWQALRADGQRVGRIVHCWSLDAPAAADLRLPSLEEAERWGCRSALRTVQSLGRAGWGENARLWLVTQGAQPVIAGQPLSGLAQSPLWGLGRVISEELPAVWGGLLDLDPAMSPREGALRVFGEIVSGDDEDQVAYRGDQRYAARLVPRGPAAVRPDQLRCRSDASYLVSGGLGDLGLRIAEWLVARGARTLVLFGRSPLPPRGEWDEVARQDPHRAGQIGKIREFEAAGVRVRVAALDVADREALADLLVRLEAEGLPPIRGVIHAAGIASPQTILELPDDELSSVLRPKVAGSWVLHDLFSDARLDFFVSFSSGAALLGSPLLGSYAAANAFLDALAHHRRAVGQPALSVNWGFWDQIGMVARSQRDLGRGFAPQGMQSFSPEQGLAALQQLLETGATQAAVIPVDWRQWGDFHPRAIHAPLLRHVAGFAAATPAGSDEELPDQRLDRAAILAALPAERRERLQDLLGQQLARVLHLPARDLDPDQPLNDLGIDSLMAVELRNHVQARLGVVIPVARLLQNPSIAELTETLMAELAEAGGEEDLLSGLAAAERAEPAREVSPQPSAGETLAHLDQMSDEEVEKLLNQLRE